LVSGTNHHNLPDQLSEEDLQSAMTVLDIQPEPLDDQDRQDIAATQAPHLAAKKIRY